MPDLTITPASAAAGPSVAPAGDTAATAAATAAAATTAGTAEVPLTAAASGLPLTAAAAFTAAADPSLTAVEGVDGAARGSFLTEHLSRFFDTVGAEWVMWILLVLSVASVAVMIDRFLYVRRRRSDNDKLAHAIDQALAEGKVDEAMAAAKAVPSLAGTVLTEALAHYHDGATAVEEASAGALTRERPKFERGLAFLGTLGNNAPFIGLFGTVLGIIRSFADLARHGAAAGASSVMAGIAEALVATAVGLLVAIPAVMSFNYLQRRIRGESMQAQAMVHVVLARLARAPAAGAPYRDVSAGPRSAATAAAAGR
ncbi:MAG TPA: MotA/TolQ/ExbB proton channel family protein [Myxococcota bacterium]|jgi:biopolymer transport protein ExbB|nr:MotA/TolQ/ExbB proton channel family protein [Myxococcota bacterium]